MAKKPPRSKTTVRIFDDILEALDVKALRRNLSRNQLIEMILADHLHKQEKAKLFLRPDL